MPEWNDIGIVLSAKKYGEKGLIINILTETHGRYVGWVNNYKSKSILSIGLGCEAKYAKEFVYTENLDLTDKKSELPIGVSCRTCDRLDCSQRAFPPLHKKFDVDINSRGVSVYVNE